jgi:excisionase family DNA binding protein
MEQQYLTIKDVCEKLYLSRSSIYNYVSGHKIPYVKLGGKLLFIESDINNWINSKKKEAIS